MIGVPKYCLFFLTLATYPCTAQAPVGLASFGRGTYPQDMLSTFFAPVQTWVFDLDNTLYPPHVRLFDQIEARMTDYVQKVLGVDEPTANHLRRKYWEDHGTTLAGLMREHDVDPDPYLEDVHDISFDPLDPDPELAAHIRALPGRKIVYTNGSAPYAKNVIQARGLSGIFDAIYGVEHAGYLPKPEAGAFAKVFGRDGFDTTLAAMFEDELRNLEVPHALGVRTVHVAPEASKAPFVHHHTSDLTGFLAQIHDA